MHLIFLKIKRIKVHTITVYIQRFAVIGFPGVSASLNGYVANAVHNSNQKFDHQDQDLISLNQLQKYLQGE